MYLRQNATEEFLGDMRNISQSTVSRIVSTLVPAVKAVLEEFVPSAADAIEMERGRVCLVDGTITPCWSYGTTVSCGAAARHHRIQRAAGEPARRRCHLHF